MTDSLRKVVLITGASSGIGAGTARVLASTGSHLVLGARRTDKLKSLAADLDTKGNGEVRFRALDVTDLDDVQGFAVVAAIRAQD